MYATISVDRYTNRNAVNKCAVGGRAAVGRVSAARLGATTYRTRTTRCRTHNFGYTRTITYALTPTIKLSPRVTFALARNFNTNVNNVARAYNTVSNTITVVNFIVDRNVRGPGAGNRACGLSHRVTGHFNRGGAAAIYNALGNVNSSRNPLHDYPNYVSSTIRVTYSILGRLTRWTTTARGQQPTHLRSVRGRTNHHH